MRWIERDAELAERQEMAVDAAPTDHVAARLAEHRAPATGEQRRGEEERRTDLAGEGRGQLVGPELLRGDAHGVTVDIDNARAQRAGDLEHVAHVADVREVAQRHRFVGEEAGRDQRKRFVLVAGRSDLSAQRRPALDDEACHRAKG